MTSSLEHEAQHAEPEDQQRDERRRRERERDERADRVRRTAPRALGTPTARTSCGPASSVRSYSRCASMFSSVTRLPRAAAHAPNQIVSSRPMMNAAIASGA